MPSFESLDRIARREGRLAARDKVVGAFLALGMVFNLAFVSHVARASAAPVPAIAATAPAAAPAAPVVTAQARASLAADQRLHERDLAAQERPSVAARR
jgi:hypothetical protein